MSWDVMIFNLRDRSAQPSVQSLEGTDVQPLGPAAKVRSDIADALPGIDWSDPKWGLYRDHRDELWIEFNAGNDDPIMDLMLHVRGSGDAIAAIMAVTRPHGWSAVDCSTGEFLDPNDPSDAGWRYFQAFRDKVVGQGGPAEVRTRAQTGNRQNRHDPRLYAAGCSWLFGIVSVFCTQSSSIGWRVGLLCAALAAGAVAGYAAAWLLNRRRTSD
jgi:hypothetical protein